MFQAYGPCHVDLMKRLSGRYFNYSHFMRELRPRKARIIVPCHPTGKWQKESKKKAFSNGGRKAASTSRSGKLICGHVHPSERGEILGPASSRGF